ncbi:hypothetical protein TPENAI_20052 [Tenacibaculum litopenaei]|uniref:hypothetical protein n=1 Tax=Tenacibaculum litopenaei TaxID=396016 RepID=UPI003894F901
MSGNNSTEHINNTMNSQVSEQTNVANQEETITKLNLRSHTAYIDAEPYISNPYALLGMVLQIRKVDGNCPSNLADPNYLFEFTPYPIKRKIDESSKLTKPTLRSSIVVDKQLASNVSFLSYLSAELSSESFFSLMVFDQATGIINQHDPEWPSNVRQWRNDNQDLINDPEICYLFAISGFVQKNIVRKKYKKFKAGAKGGGFGMNIGGELATSTDEYSLDIKFGINPIVLKRPRTTNTAEIANLVATPTIEENILFEGLTGSTFQSFTKLSR